MAALRFVFVKITIFTLITDPAKMKQYLLNCVTYGSGSVLFPDPKITAAFYLLMTNAAGAIQTAINTWTEIGRASCRERV